MLVVLLTVLAHANCPWETPIETIDSSLSTVVIDGRVSDVAGQMERIQFARQLRACGASPNTIKAFEEWRLTRRLTNYSLAFLWFPPAIIATGVAAVVAGEKKFAFLTALHDDLQ